MGGSEILSPVASLLLSGLMSSAIIVNITELSGMLTFRINYAVVTVLMITVLHGSLGWIGQC
jgi:hypothetical protein